MPPRSVKMKRRILGFQRRVWWPKWTPASRSSRMETTDTDGSSSVSNDCCRRERVEPGEPPRHRHPRCPPGRVRNRSMVADGAPKLTHVPGVVRQSAWDLAVECVDEALACGLTPSLERLGRLGQLGSLPSFIASLSQEEDLATLADDYAHERESLGLGPGEIAAELLVLGRVLGRHGEEEARRDLERCIVAYVERVTGELAERARRDPLTGLLNHRAFHLDRFKETNDRDGHQEGDRLLRAFAAALAGTVRETDFAARTGGDEFAALLVEAGPGTVEGFLARLGERLPEDFAVSTGAAYLPEECSAAEQLLEAADRRLYADKTAKAA